MVKRNLEEFAKWLGLEPGKKYLISGEDKPIIIDKYYNYYYEGDNLGNSLISLSLFKLLNLREYKDR